MTSTTVPADPPEDLDRDCVHVENGTVWMWSAQVRTWTRMNALPPDVVSQSGEGREKIGVVTQAGRMVADVAADAHQAGITRPGEAYRRGR